MNDETLRKMIKMRMDGATYQEIGDAFGMSKQNAQDVLSRYYKRLSGHRGRGFNIENIAYEGIYDFFDKNKKNDGIKICFINLRQRCSPWCSKGANLYHRGKQCTIQDIPHQENVRACRQAI